MQPGNSGDRTATAIGTWGKNYRAARIVRAMPPHDAYLEPFAGGAAVLLRKPPAAREVLGDIARS